MRAEPFEQQNTPPRARQAVLLRSRAVAGSVPPDPTTFVRPRAWRPGCVPVPRGSRAFCPPCGHPSNQSGIFEIPGPQGTTLMQRGEDGYAQGLILLHPGADFLRPGVGLLAVAPHPHLMDGVVLR